MFQSCFYSQDVINVSSNVPLWPEVTFSTHQLKRLPTVSRMVSELWQLIGHKWPLGHTLVSFNALARGGLPLKNILIQHICTFMKISFQKTSQNTLL